MKTYTWQVSADLDVEAIAHLMVELSDRYDLENPYGLRSLAIEAACTFMNNSDINFEFINYMPEETMNVFITDVMNCYKEMTK